MLAQPPAKHEILEKKIRAPQGGHLPPGVHKNASNLRWVRAAGLQYRLCMDVHGRAWKLLKLQSSCLLPWPGPLKPVRTRLHDSMAGSHTSPSCRVRAA